MAWVVPGCTSLTWVLGTGVFSTSGNSYYIYIYIYSIHNSSGIKFEAVKAIKAVKAVGQFIAVKLALSFGIWVLWQLGQTAVARFVFEIVCLQACSCSIYLLCCIRMFRVHGCRSCRASKVPTPALESLWDDWNERLGCETSHIWGSPWQFFVFLG